MRKKFICAVLAAVFFMVMAPLGATRVLAATEEEIEMPAEASEPLNLADSLDWLQDVTLTGADGAALGEDTPPGASFLLTYTFAIPADAGIRAGDYAAIALPGEISTAPGESFEILGDEGAQIALAAYDGQNIIVTFSGGITSQSAGTFSLRLNFNEENIGGENPVNIVFPLSCGHTKTIDVNFEKAQAIAATDAAPLAGTIVVKNGETLDLSKTDVHKHIVVEKSAKATILNNNATTTFNTIYCEVGVELTLQNVNLDLSDTPDACPLTFEKYGSLILAGNNHLSAGQNQPGVKVQEQELWRDDLVIKGDGMLTVVGGPEGAGIGGESGHGGGVIYIKDGDIKATGGEGAAGIGGGSGGGSGQITIFGGSVTATGGKSAAGIGGGNNGKASSAGDKITISGATVIATGGTRGAGIGSGEEGDWGSIIIERGKVAATGGAGGAGIGGGYESTGGGITIKDGNVDATGGDEDADSHGGGGGTGIGGGGGLSKNGDITITGGTVKATGGTAATGIGAGFLRSCGTIYLKGGFIYAGKGYGASYDLGDTGIHALEISGGAAVFLKNNRCVSWPLLVVETGYQHKSKNDTENPMIFVKNTVYELTVPASWTDATGGYFLMGTLSYNANGGSGSRPASVTKIKGKTTQVAANPFTAEGFVFDGWNTKQYGSGTDYAAGDTFTLAGDTTLYAQWREPSTIQFLRPDGETITTDSRTIYTGGRVTLTPHIEGGTWIYDKEYLSRDGNTFKGLQPGRTQVTYTVGWASGTVTITIVEASLPDTGQDFTWAYLLLAAAAAAVILALCIKAGRKKAL